MESVSDNVSMRLARCEAVPYPQKKKLNLENLDMTAADIPLTYICGTHLGHALHKLSLARNPLKDIPTRLVQSFPTLKNLDLSECRLHELPATWNLPQLRKLNLSHNQLGEFPDEVSARRL